MLIHFPLFLRLGEADRILIIGGGAVAKAKVETLLSGNVPLQLVAKTIQPSLRTLLNERGIPYRIGAFSEDDLTGIRIVIAATGDKPLNARIASAARQRHIPVNVVDDAAQCDFIFPAIVRRGDLQIAISSSAASPVLARLIKQRIERALPWNLERLAQFIRARRQTVSRTLKAIQPRRLFWEQVIDGPIAQEVLEHNDGRADSLFQNALADFPKQNRAALYLISAGPGHPDYITVRGTQLLAQADVVLYDRLVAPELLDRYARRDAEKICVGKERSSHPLTQQDIDRLIAENLQNGYVVARLKGGDAGIYAHAAEEIAIARALGAPYQIVPGITAASGCAAMAGIPLTERGNARSVRLLTLYDKDIHDRSFWQSLSLSRNETLVFYMSIKHRIALCENLLNAGFPPETPILAVEQGTTPQHREYEATLGTFPAYYGDYPFLSPTLFIVGDVVRWRQEHHWREPAAQRKPFFIGREETGYATS